MHFSGGNDEVFGGVVLQDEPHALDVVFGISPVAPGIQIAQIQLVLLALCDSCRCKCDLSGNEGLSAALGLMVE